MSRPGEAQVEQLLCRLQVHLDEYDEAEYALQVRDDMGDWSLMHRSSVAGLVACARCTLEIAIRRMREDVDWDAEEHTGLLAAYDLVSAWLASVMDEDDDEDTDIEED